MDLHLQVTCVNYEIFQFLKESFESDVTYIKYKIFTKSEEERANEMLHTEVKDNASNFFRLHRFNIQNTQKFAINFDYE